MNKNRHRVIFNAARGQRMVVAESASSSGGAGDTTGPRSAQAPLGDLDICKPSRLRQFALHPLTLSIGLVLALGFSLYTSAHAQIVADPSAPGNQRPTVLQAGNGVPVVNIQTPSAAGVSRNTYSQFDVQANGAILNNSRTNVQTQLGGYVSGNPWIGTPARVILNEVNSSHPSYLQGPVEVAGQRAEVIIANPSGIRVNGGTFLNAAGVTLTTGTPVMNSGNLESFRVAQGAVVIEGLGLDTRTADHTRILARAVEVNAGLWANHLKVVTGANAISADASAVTATPASAQGTAPQFALDVAAIGGMYAGHIFLVGTETGLGVNNGGVISAGAGDLVLEADGWLRNAGTLQASGNVAIGTQGAVSNEKDVYAGGTVSITTPETLTNRGNIDAQGTLQIQAAATANEAGARIASNATVRIDTAGAQANRGNILSAGDMALQAGAVHNEGRMLSAGNLGINSLGDVANTGPNAQMYAAGVQHIDAAGALTNSGLIAARSDLTMAARSVNSTGALAAGLNTDGSLHDAAALLQINATEQLTAQGTNLASGHLQLQGQALDISGSQTRAKTLELNATGRNTAAAPGSGEIDASQADLLAQATITIEGQTLRTDGAQLQAVGDIHIRADQLSNRAGLIRTNAALDIVSGHIDNRDTRAAPGADPDLAPKGLIGRSVQLSTSELLNQGGAVIATDQLTVQGASASGPNRIENAAGLLSAASTLEIRATDDNRFSLTNTGGTLIADQMLTVAAQTLSLDGDVLSQLDMQLSVRGNHTQTQGARTIANRDLTLDIANGDLSNSGLLYAGRQLAFTAASLDNTASGEIGAGTTTDIQLTQDLSNRGLIDGNHTQLRAQDLSNLGSGRIQGDALTITALGDLNNTGALAQIYAAGDQQVRVTGALTNSGLMAAHGNLSLEADSVHSTGALAAGLNTDGSLKTAAALLQVQANGPLVAQGTHLSSGHIQLEGQTLDMANSQTRAQTLSLNATGLIDASHADVLAQGRVDIEGGALDSTGARLQAVGDMQITVDQLNNRAGLIRSGGHLTAVAAGIDNRDTRTATGAAPLGIVAQAVDLTTGELLNQGGAVMAEHGLNIVSGGRIDNTQGLLSAGGTLDVRETTAVAPAPAARTLSITNTGGTLIADQQLAVTAKSLSLDGDLLSQQDMALSVQGDHALGAGARIVANRDLSLHIEGGGLHNSGQLLAGRHLGLTAEALDNTATGEISAGNTTDIRVAGTLNNRGLIDGKNTLIQADALNNIGTGRIYGDVLAIQANSLLNDTETVAGVRSDAVIAARERLDIGVQTLVNREGAAIFSLGDMALGGALDASRRADGATSGMALQIQNQSATIEALGALSIATQTLENTNPHFTYTVTPVAGSGTPKADYYVGGSYISSDDVAWSVVEYDGPYESRDPSKSGTKILLKNGAYTDPAFQAYYTGPVPFVEGHDLYWNDGDTGGVIWVPDTYGYDRDSSIWAAFGMQAPAWNHPGQKPRTTYAADDSGQSYPPDPVALADWETKIVPWVQLTALYNSFKTATASQLIPVNLKRTYTETEQAAEVLSSQPARIVSGAGMALNIGQSALNQNSHIVAGGSLSVSGAAVTNQATQVSAPTLRNGTLSSWTVVGVNCGAFGCEAQYDWANSAYAESISRTVSLPSIRYEANAASGQAPLSIGALGSAVAGGPVLPGGLFAPSAGTVPALVNTHASASNTATGQAAAVASASAGASGSTTSVSSMALPTSGLFKPSTDPGSRYVVETDPRFADYRQWISSDYLLQALSIDPATAQKRLGDSFYEQRLVREQIAALTGRRFLGDYTSDDAQYQALMTAGATFAQAFQLRPGIALSAEQVAQLTSDIVWLVTETVTLPDGSTQQVLVPRVYALLREGDLTETGALLSGQSVSLNLTGDLTNAGTIGGRQITQISAANVNNLGGVIGGGNSTLINAQQDIRNLGGSISAIEELRLGAGRDITVQSTASQGFGDTGQGVYSSQGIDRVAGLYVSQDAGVLIASAGGNVDLSAALIQSAGTVNLQAVGDISLGTVNTATSMDATRNARNFTRIEQTGEVGTQIQAGGDVSLNAGQSVNARAATVQAGGELEVDAGQDVNITAGEQSLSTNTAAYARARSGLNAGSSELKEQRSQTGALGSSLGGERVNIQSGGDTTVRGSSAIGDAGVTIQAGGDVNIVAAQTESSANRFEEHKSSGVSFAGVGITWGSQRQSSDQDNQGTGSVASTVGAITGDVNISAGQSYTQVGSDVMAPGGDIAISAKNVQITEARETQRSEMQQEFEQSGVTLAVSSPVIAAMQSISSQMDAAGETKDARMKGLAAANSAFAVNNAMKAIEQGQGQDYGGKSGQIVSQDAAGNVTSRDATAADKAGGVNVAISFGSSSSESKSLETGDSARGSTVSAGGSVSITASGAGADSNILIRGSDISAGTNANLSAEGDVNLLAAQNTASLSGSNKSDSGSVGISFGTSGFGITASASSARGKEAGDDLTQTNTHITAGDKVSINSGNDTTLQGALVKADTIQANVGGDLKIESLQDTSTYDSKQKSASASVTIGAGASGSFSASKSNVSSDFASVSEQSGFKAGDGGFQVNVSGDTTLIGGAIASNQSAVENNLNSFTTGGTLTTTEIQNKAEYSASSTSVGIGGGTDGKNKGISGVGVGVGSDSGNASSTTTAGISGIAGDTAIRSTDAETGIARIFDKEQVQKEIEAQAKITEAFGRDASKAIGDYAATQMKQAQTLRAQANAEADPDKRAQLTAQADQLEADWGDNGKLRLLAHTVVGGLTGGMSGAIGATTGTLAAPAVAQALADAGVDGALAKTLTAIASTAVGTAAGGTAGGAAAMNEVANNYLKHTEVQKLGQLKDARMRGLCDSACEQEIKTLETLDQQRNTALAACDGAISEACTNLRQEVRNAAAEYLRADNKSLDFRYSQESNETLALARDTTNGVAGGALKAAGQSLADAANGLASAAKTAFAALAGDPQAQQDILRAAGAMADYVANPDNWPYLLGAMTPETREQLAQAYERGDGPAIGQLMGTQVLEVLGNTPVAGGAGIIKKVDKAAGTVRSIAAPVYKTTKEASTAAELLGFKRINETIHDGQAVFRRGNEFITRDLDGHNGGAWKMADSVKNLGSKETRFGTYDANLNRIGD